MVIERTKKETVLRIPKSFSSSGLKKVIRYLQYKEMVKDSKATAIQIKELVNLSKTTWWAANKAKYIK